MSWANIHTGYFYFKSSYSCDATLKSSPHDFIVHEITLQNEILFGKNVSFNPATIPMIRSAIPQQVTQNDQKEDLNVKKEMELKIGQGELEKVKQYQQQAENGKSHLFFSHNDSSPDSFEKLFRVIDFSPSP
jgi:hypothetical protein